MFNFDNIEIKWHLERVEFPFGKSTLMLTGRAFYTSRHGEKMVFKIDKELAEDTLMAFNTYRSLVRELNQKIEDYIVYISDGIKCR